MTLQRSEMLSPIQINASCPVCHETNLQDVLKIDSFPVISNRLWQSSEAAKATDTGEIQLTFCKNCGHLFNRTFNPSLLTYNKSYENSLEYSSVFQQYARELALHLTRLYHLRGKKIVEIGCGKGDFLKMLCEIGDNRGIGFDPALAENVSLDEPKVSLIADTYSEFYQNLDADFIYSRHTLEHIYQPGLLITSIRNTIQENKNCGIFFEVPSLEYMLNRVSIWDVIYEHYSYFSQHSIQRLFAQSNIAPIEISERYGGQFLCFAGTSQRDDPKSFRPDSSPFGKLQANIEIFAAQSQAKINYWREFLERASQLGKKVVLWGAGSKGITFLNLLNFSDDIQTVIDVNPRKEGMFITGTGQRILSPNALLEIKPDIILIMNPIYRDEIDQKVKASGLVSEIKIVG
jgi:hypothetical protein